MLLKLIKRLARHFLILPSAVKRYFPSDSMRRLEQAIATSEIVHFGEICFVVETNLHAFDIFRKKSAKKRAIEVFFFFFLLDNAQNNVVFFYLLLEYHDFDIFLDF